MPTLAKIKAMTDEEVRIAMAETQGWERWQNIHGQIWLTSPDSDDVRQIWTDAGYCRTDKPVEFIRDDCPRYQESLDALQPLKEGLTPEQKKRFAEALYHLSQCGPFVKYHSDEPAWYSIAIIASEPASIQSRAILAALTE